MLSKPDALKALRASFKKERVVMLPDITAVLGTTSPMSAFRRLRDLNYLSSFSHVGRYYTLPALANFDPQGLWFYEDVGFSRFGHLKETVIHLVDQSVAGKTHEELEKQLRLRVHNTLLDLVRSGKIAREAFEGVFVYLSIRTDGAQQQRVRRREGVRKRAGRTAGRDCYRSAGRNYSRQPGAHRSKRHPIAACTEGD